MSETIDALRLERLTQLAYLGFDFTGGGRNRGKRDRPVFRHCPHEAVVVTEIKRQQRFARFKRRFDVGDGRRFGIDQVCIAREPGLVVTRALSRSARSLSIWAFIA